MGHTYANKLIIVSECVENVVGTMKEWAEGYKVTSTEANENRVVVWLESEGQPIDEETLFDVSETFQASIFGGYIRKDIGVAGYCVIANGQLIEDEPLANETIADLIKQYANKDNEANNNKVIECEAIEVMATNEVNNETEEGNQDMENAKKVDAATFTAGMATYANKSGFQTHVSIAAEGVELLGWDANTRVTYQTVTYRLKEGGSKKVLFIKKSDKGLKLIRHGRSLMMAAYNYEKATHSRVNYIAYPHGDGFYIVLEETNKFDDKFDRLVGANDNKGVTASKKDILYKTSTDFIKSIQPGYPGAKARLDLIRGALDANTEAGDECYTPRALVDCGLKAAGVDAYDLDVCTMNEKGEYQHHIKKIRGGKVIEFSGVPAKRHLTRSVSELGSLGVEWKGKVVWCNPPYGNRAWVAWLEKANREVEVGNVEVVVCLVPDDLCHGIGVYNTTNSFEIRLEDRVPFYKPNAPKDKQIAGIASGNTFVLYGKGKSFKEYAKRFLNEVLYSGYISEGYYAYKMMELETTSRWED